MAELTIAQKLRENLAWMRQNGASKQEIDAEIAAARRALSGKSREEINAAEQEIAGQPSYGEQVNRRLLALTSQVPGAHALIAGGRAALDGNVDYADATRDIDRSVAAYNADDSEKWRRRALKIAGIIPTGVGAGRIASTVAGQGALLGAAEAAGTADPNMSLVGRGARTAIGGVTGGLFGKLGDVASTAIGTIGVTKPAQKLLQMQAERAKSAKALYDAAKAEGDASLIGPVSKQVNDFVNEPDIAEIVADLAKTRKYRGKNPTDPEMLDGIIKELSDRAGVIKKGQMSPSPSRPNVGRTRAEDVKAASEQGLEAISGPGGPMPTYRKAVADYANRSKQLEAYKRGYTAVGSEAVVGLPPISNLQQRSPESLGNWLMKTKATDDIRRAAAEGVEGATKEARRRMSLIRPLWSLAAVEALSEAPTVMRTAGLPRTQMRSLFDLGTSTLSGGLGGALGGIR